MRKGKSGGERITDKAVRFNQGPLLGDRRMDKHAPMGKRRKSGNLNNLVPLRMGGKPSRKDLVQTGWGHKGKSDDSGTRFVVIELYV